MKRNKKKQVLLRWTAVAIVSGLVLLLFLTMITLAGGFGPMPGKEELKNLRDERATLVYSSDGKLIGKIFSRNRTPVGPGEIPSHLTDALIVTEDIRFYTHNGIDSRSLMRVMVKSLLLGNRESGGGSTITQQLAKNLYGRRNIGFLTIPAGKIREAILAGRIEEVYSKDEILLLYLNTVPFGEEVYGVEAAANRYFNKSVSALKPEESALLVGMLKANTLYHPGRYPERALERRNLVISLMLKHERIDSLEAARLKDLPLKLEYSNLRREGLAQYFVYQVEKKAREILREYAASSGRTLDIEKDGLRIFTSLDMRLQELALASVRQHLSAMQPALDRDPHTRQLKRNFYAGRDKGEAENHRAPRELWSWEGVKADSMTVTDSLWHYHRMLHAGVYAMEPATGKVRVWVGGNHFRYLPYDLVLARRPIASAFKPMLYTVALENGYGPCFYLDNGERVYQEYDDWAPVNYDGTSGGESALWYALVHSQNLPTVDLYFRLGYEALENFCIRFDIPVPPRDRPAVSLGTFDMSLPEATKVYACLANEGAVAKPVIIEKIIDAEGKLVFEQSVSESVQVMRSDIAQGMTAMLRRVMNEGTGASIRTAWGVQSDMAGKTGTSQDFSDAWFFWYTPGLAGGVWVGARDPQVHFSSGSMGSGTALALPVAGRMI